VVAGTWWGYSPVLGKSNLLYNIGRSSIFLLSALRRSCFIAITRIALSPPISYIYSDKTYRVLV